MDKNLTAQKMMALVNGTGLAVDPKLEEKLRNMSYDEIEERIAKHIEKKEKEKSIDNSPDCHGNRAERRAAMKLRSRNQRKWKGRK